MSFIVLGVLTVFPIFNKMDDISARQESDTVALSDDDLIPM